MFEPIYRIFISSTYCDLVDERTEIIQSIIERGYIPLGMELFPSSNRTIEETINKEIKTCDYYVLIIGDRYGTIRDEGISFTEWEYNIAKELEIPIIIFVKDSLEKKKEQERELIKFKSTIEKNHSIGHFKEIRELSRRFSIALSKEIMICPRPGLFAENNYVYQTLRALEAVYPSFHHDLYPSISQYREQNIDEMFERTKERTVADRNLLYYWEQFLAYRPFPEDQNRFRKNSFYQCIRKLVEKGFIEHADGTDKIDESSIQSIFSIYKALGLINDQYAPTEFGIHIGKQISTYRIEL